MIDGELSGFRPESGDARTTLGNKFGCQPAVPLKILRHGRRDGGGRRQG